MLITLASLMQWYVILKGSVKNHVSLDVFYSEPSCMDTALNPVNPVIAYAKVRGKYTSWIGIRIQQ